MKIEDIEKEQMIDCSKKIKAKKKRKNSHAKGARGELELTKILMSRFTGKAFKRVPASGALFGGKNRYRAKDTDEEIIVTLSGDIITPLNFKFSIEHKFYQNNVELWELFNESSHLHSWFKQCLSDSEFSNKEPMLVVKYNNHKRICFLKTKLDGYVFETDGWYCYWFQEVLKQEDSFFFNEVEKSE